MSAPQSPLTYEGILEMFRQNAEQRKETDREFDRKFDRMIEEADRRRKDIDQQMKETNKKISALGSRIGEIVESMVSGNGNIVDKFYALGYKITEWNPHKKFWDPDTNIRGEVDVFLENGDAAILIEVKTSLETADVRDHIKRLEKFRRYADVKGDKRHFIGAVAGAVVDDEAKNFAHENGMYVIVQSGEAVEIVTPPEGFTAKEW